MFTVDGTTGETNGPSAPRHDLHRQTRQAKETAEEEKEYENSARKKRRPVELHVVTWRERERRGEF